MKKLISLLLVVCMVLLLCACGAQGAKEAEKEVAPAPAPVAEEKPAEPEATPEPVSWPTDTVTVYVPAKAGGNNDLVARVFTNYFQEKTGVPFVVVNNMDGNGTVCYDMVKNAKADGCTLMYFTTALNIAHYTGVYDSEIPSSFDYAACLKAATSAAMVVAADSQFETAEQLAAYIKEHPGEVVCGTQLGASNHLMAAIFELNAGGAFKHVEAGSTPDKLAALQGGHIQVSFINTNSVSQYVESGELRVLGLFTSDGERDSASPEFPTLVEQGFDKCIFAVDGVFFAQEGIDPAILKQINEMVEEALNDPTVQQQLVDLKQTFTFTPFGETESYLDAVDGQIHEACLGAGLCNE